MKDKKKQIILIVLAVLSLVLITVGVTYAFFNYAKEGSTDNTLTTGVITFIYEEVDKQGAGISIKDAFPMSDGNGKIQEGTGKVFNFKVTSQTPTTQSIPYIVTARKSVNSTLNDEVVKVFLKEVSTTDTELLLDVYKELDDYNNAPEGITEKIIHTDTVPAGTQNWNKEYELRLWISEEADYTDATVNGQTFTITVNVYANAEIVKQEVITTMTSQDKLTVGESVTAIDGSKWHVLEASEAGNETVVLLSDYNLNTDGTYNTTCGWDIDGNTRCSSVAFDTDNTQNYDEEDENNIGYFVKNTYSPIISKSLVGTTNITIPTAEQIANVQGITFDPTSTTNYTLTRTWATTTNYWTKTANTSTVRRTWLMWASIPKLEYEYYTTATDHVGIRPVITTPKSNLIKN